MRVDRSKVSADVGLRSALGVGLTLVVGRASGHTIAGVTATIGALSAGMASHQGTYRSRAAVVLAAASAMAAAAFVGGTVGDVVGADMAVTALVAFWAGMLVSLGPAGMVVGIQAVVGLVVFTQFSLSVTAAAEDAGLVLLGGAVQAVLVVVLWPLRRFPAERKALGTAFAALADFSRSALSEGAILMDPAPFESLSALMTDSQPFGGEETVIHQALVGQAERMRLELVAAARARDRVAASAGPVEVAAMDDILETTASVLDEVAVAVRDVRVPSAWVYHRERFEAGLERLHEASVGAGRDPARHLAVAEAERRAEFLAGQVRAVIRIAAVPAGGDPRALEALALSGRLGVPSPARRSAGEWLAERLGTLRSNLDLSSQTFRHALRLAATLAVAFLVAHALPMAHPYWLPMTAMLVLRPDFGSTVTRGLSRVAGTLVGAGLVTLVLAEARPGPVWLIGLVIVLCFAATTLVLANYAAFSVCIASLVVTLLAFVGQPGVATAGDRSVYTVAGAALALLAYVSWPTWEATTLADTLADLTAVEATYAGRVLRAWADPARADRAALQQARMEARLARSNAEAAVARWLTEPGTRPAGEGGGTPMGRDTVLGYMAAVRGCVGSVLALHAGLPPEGPPVPSLEGLAGDVERSLEAVAATVKGSPPDGPLPPLRHAQLELTAELGLGRAAGTGPCPPRPPGLSDGPALALAGETDLLVNSVNTLAHLAGLEVG